MSSLLRILAIAIVAFLSGPRVSLAADGVWTVICDGATGAPTLALYDFETGEIADPAVVIEMCGFCYLVDTAVAPRAPFSIAEPVALSHDRVASAIEPDRSTLRMADARAPPVPVKA
ncbi:MAG: hypothetical protein AAFU55_04465 [Pseudomonadota bacterium]